MKDIVQASWGALGMTGHIRVCVTLAAALLILAFVFGLTRAWGGGLGFLVVMIGTPLWLLMLVIGALILSVRGILAASRGRPATHRTMLVLLAPLLMVGTSVLALPVVWSGSFLGTCVRLMVSRHHYEAIIAREAGSSPSRRDGLSRHQRGITYYVDRGPPLRIAFDPDGLLDNWSGIIFDPTGVVMEAKGFDPQTGAFRAPDIPTKLFGGDLVQCRKLWGDYYHCSFT